MVFESRRNLFQDTLNDATSLVVNGIQELIQFLCSFFNFT